MVDQFRTDLLVGRDEVTPTFQQAAAAMQNAEVQARDYGTAIDQTTQSNVRSRDAVQQLSTELSENLNNAFSSQLVLLRVTDRALSRFSESIDSFTDKAIAAGQSVGAFIGGLFTGRTQIELVTGAIDLLTGRTEELAEALERVARLSGPELVAVLEAAGDPSARAIGDVRFQRGQRRRSDQRRFEERERLTEEFLQRRAAGSRGELPGFPEETFFGPERPPDRERARSRDRVDKERVATIEDKIEFDQILLDIEKQRTQFLLDEEEQRLENTRRLEDLRKAHIEFVAEEELRIAQDRSDKLLQLAEAEIAGAQAAEKSRIAGLKGVGQALGGLSDLLGGVAALEIVAELAEAASDTAASASAFAAFNPIQGVAFAIAAAQHVAASIEWAKVGSRSGRGGGAGSAAGAAGGGGVRPSAPRAPPPQQITPEGSRGVSGVTLVFNGSVVGLDAQRAGQEIVGVINRHGERNSGQRFLPTLIDRA